MKARVAETQSNLKPRACPLRYIVAQVNVWSSYVRTWNKDWICSTVVERLCYGSTRIKLQGIGARSILQRYNNECPLCLSFFFKKEDCHVR